MNKTINIEKYDFEEFEKEGLPFTLICNKVIQNITNAQAALIWMYLQSMPSTWTPNKQHLMNHFQISDRTYQRNMAYLAACNLVSYVRVRNKNGTLGPVRLVIKNGTNFKLALGSDHTAKIDVVDFNHTAKKPQCGEPTVVAFGDHINKTNNINTISHTQEDDFFLENNLFLDAEQKRKAVLLRQQCLKDRKCLDKFDQMKSKHSLDKTFIEILDECITHYATEQQPRLVSPGRLLSWLGREDKFQVRAADTKATNKPKFTAPQEREKLKLEAIARERKEQYAKEQEAKAAPAIMKELRNKLSFEERALKAEKERLSLGMSHAEYLEYRKSLDNEQKAM